MINTSISALKSAYTNGELTPKQVIAEIIQRNAEYANKNIWIYQLSMNELTPYLQALEKTSPDALPLWGIPFAIKDNIDLSGIPTTAACPEYTYTPELSATVVAKLIEAGAIPIGKTNLDQFATGLNGTRTPYGACHNAFDDDYISGGSSAGSAVAVALGLASFGLGTDTAGSGRVPACFNNLIGLKPSRGMLSNTGVVRACRSLDCVSIFTLNTDDANTVLSVAEGHDETDEYSRENPYSNSNRHYGVSCGVSCGVSNHPLKIGVLPEDQLEFFGEDSYAQAYQETIQNLSSLDIEFIEVDYAPFLATAKLLYEGPWVSERYLGTLPLSKDNPEAMLDVIREIIEPGGVLLATDVFAAQYKLTAFKKQCLAQLKSLDCLLAPTTSKHFTIEEMQQAPNVANRQLGQYTNFVNLLDLSAIAIPTTFTNKSLPFGITLIANHFQDRKLLSIANTLQQHLQLPLGATNLPLSPSQFSTPKKTGNCIEIIVCGAHMQGLPLNWQLTERGGQFLEKTTTTDGYRLYALAGGPPFRPALVFDGEKGSHIEVEVWSIPTVELGSFVEDIPAPLGIGKVKLKDGRTMCGFICESHCIMDAIEITEFGGWRSYLVN